MAEIDYERLVRAIDKRWADLLEKAEQAMRERDSYARAPMTSGAERLEAERDEALARCDRYCAALGTARRAVAGETMESSAELLAYIDGALSQELKTERNARKSKQHPAPAYNWWSSSPLLKDKAHGPIRR